MRHGLAKAIHACAGLQAGCPAHRLTVAGNQDQRPSCPMRRSNFLFQLAFSGSFGCGRGAASVARELRRRGGAQRGGLGPEQAERAQAARLAPAPTTKVGAERRASSAGTAPRARPVAPAGGARAGGGHGGGSWLVKG
jgi:hypothetical protein